MILTMSQAVLSALSIISVNTTEEEQGMAGSGKAERQREESSGEGIRSLRITVAIQREMEKCGRHWEWGQESKGSQWLTPEG